MFVLKLNELNFIPCFVLWILILSTLFPQVCLTEYILTFYKTVHYKEISDIRRFEKGPQKRCI